MTANEKYITQIEEGIARYQYEVKLSQKTNKQHKNIYGENVVRDMLNIMYEDVSFINANSLKVNMQGIDLVCDKSGRCFQVTTDTSRDKVRNTYEKFRKLEKYPDTYSLEFFYLLEKANFNQIDQFEKELDVKDLKKGLFSFDDLVVEINNLTVDKLEELTKLFVLDNQDNSKVINPPTYKDLDKVFGRQDDLNKLDTLLQTNDRLALINGLGGIGKTTLATSYFMDKKDEYSHRYWLEYEDNLEHSFLKLYAYLFDGDMKGLEKDTALDKILDKINNTQGKNLLVIDNLSNSDDIKLISGLSENWKVLITSRKQFDEIETLELGILGEKAAKELFINASKLKNYDEEILDKILAKCGGHALTIKLIAKISFNNKKRRSLEDVLTTLDEHNFDLTTFIYRKEHRDENLVDQLVNTFKDDILKLDEIEKIILQNLSILATLEFKEEEFLSYFPLKEEHKDSFYDALEILSEYGLIKYENCKIFIHQVINDVSRRVLGLDFEVCKYLIKSFSFKIAHDPYKIFIDYIPFILDNEGILKYFGDKKEPIISNIYNNLARIYQNMGQLKNALIYQKRSIEIFENIKEYKNHSNLATAYGNLSGIYQDMGDLEKALEYQNKDIKICEEIYENKNHPNLGIAYGNLSTIYRNIGDLEKALEYKNKNIEIYEEIYENKNHPNLATAYGNLSIIYRHIGNLEKALVYQNKNIEICKEIYENKNHPNLATAYGNLSGIYQDMRNLEKALEYQNKNIEIYEEIYENKKHPNLATAYGNQSIIYQDMGDLEKALEYQNKNIEICEEIYENKNHLNLMIAYANISLAYLTIKDYQKGVKYLTRAYDIYMYKFPKGHPSYDQIKEIKEQFLGK